MWHLVNLSLLQLFSKKKKNDFKWSLSTNIAAVPDPGAYFADTPATTAVMVSIIVKNNRICHTWKVHVFCKKHFSFVTSKPSSHILRVVELSNVRLVVISLVVIAVSVKCLCRPRRVEPPHHSFTLNYVIQITLLWLSSPPNDRKENILQPQ